MGAELWETIPDLTKGLRAWGTPHAEAFLGAPAWPEAVPGDAAAGDAAAGDAAAGDAATRAPILSCATRGEALCLLLEETLQQTRLEYGNSSADAAELEDLRGWLHQATGKPYDVA